MICSSLPSSHQFWLTATCIACICISVYTLYRVNSLEQSVVECMLSHFNDSPTMVFNSGKGDNDDNNEQRPTDGNQVNPAATPIPHQHHRVEVNMVPLSPSDEQEIASLLGGGGTGHSKPPSATIEIEADEEEADDAGVPDEVEIKQRENDGSQPLSSLRISELKSMAKTMGIAAGKGTKREIIEAIEAATSS